MLAALLLNLSSGVVSTPGGEDYSRQYYEALRRQRLRREQERRDAKGQALKTAQRAAEEAYGAVLAVNPETARQIVQPYSLAKPVKEAKPRFVIDWDQVVADQVARETLLRLQMELEDEEALLLLLASDSFL